VYGAGLDEPLAYVAADGTKTYTHQDAQGSVVAVTDATGKLTSRYAYGPYGESSTLTGVARYTGRRIDPETGLYYYRARMYSPALGRFLQQDPIGTSGGVNLYAYVGNDPINLVDPSGLCAEVYAKSAFASFTFNSNINIDADLSDPSNQGAYIAGTATGIAANLALAGAGLAARGAMAAGEVGASRIANVGGFVRQFTQEADQVYYRVYSENNVGRFLTEVPPRSSAWAQEALSLPPQNSATMIQQVLVPEGTSLVRSRAIPVPEWGRMRGGAEQFELLDEIPRQNFGPGKPLP
jgi:RHS repeat-associated protein